MRYLQKRKGISPRAEQTTSIKKVILILTEGTKKCLNPEILKQ